MALATSLPRESFGALPTHPAPPGLAARGALELLVELLAPFRALADDGPFDLEQLIDPADRFQRQGRDHCRLLALGLASRVLGQISHHEEWTPTMHPAGRFQNRTRRAAALVKLGIAAIGVGLEDSAIMGQMRLRMFTRPVARVIEHCTRWFRPAKRLVIADIDPDPADVGLAFGQNWHRGVVAVQPLGAQDVGLQAFEQRRQRRRAATNLVGQGRQTDRHTLLGIALGLPVERLMLAKFLEQHHRQQAGSGPAPRDHVERRRRLADLLAVPATELLADVLDHLPGFRDHLQRLGDVLAEPGQPRSAATGTSRRSRHNYPLPRQMLRERFAGWPLARERRHLRGFSCGHFGRELVLRRRALQFLQRQLQLIQQPCGALRARAIAITVQLLDLQLQMGDQRLVVGLLSPAAAASARATIKAAFSASTSSDKASTPPFMKLMEPRAPAICGDFFLVAQNFFQPQLPALCGRQVCCGLRQSIASSK